MTFPTPPMRQVTVSVARINSTPLQYAPTHTILLVGSKITVKANYWGCFIAAVHINTIPLNPKGFVQKQSWYSSSGSKKQRKIGSREGKKDKIFVLPRLSMLLILTRARLLVVWAREWDGIARAWLYRPVLSAHSRIIAADCMTGILAKNCMTTLSTFLVLVIDNNRYFLCLCPVKVVRTNQVYQIV